MTRLIMTLALLASVARGTTAWASEPRDVPPRLGTLLATHCSGCHADREVLPLSPPPALDDTATWALIAARIRAGEMPPPSTDSLERRFPLDPEVRTELLGLIDLHLGAAADPKTGARFLSPRGWSAVVHRLARAALPPDELARAIAGVMRSRRSTTNRLRHMTPGFQVAVDRASLVICRAVATKKNFDQPPSVPERAVAVRQLEELILGQSSASTFAYHAAAYERLRTRTRNEMMAWVGLCTLFLTGPDLWYGTFNPHVTP
jgi:hypothetical protein